MNRGRAAVKRPGPNMARAFVTVLVLTMCAHFSVFVFSALGGLIESVICPCI